MVSIDFLRKNIDFTNVSPHATKPEIRKFCEDAIKNAVSTIYVQPTLLEYANSILEGEKIDIGTTSGFPYGNVPLFTKLYEIRYAASRGAKWIDACLDISSIRDENLDLDQDYINLEIVTLNKRAKEEGMRLKLIIETPYLGKEEIRLISRIADDQHVDYIKTATGVGNKVKVEDVACIKSVLKNSKLKAAGGISTLQEAELFFENGADKIGSSNGFSILSEAYHGQRPAHPA
jgi:deoxyribose-phosphate aldolase